MDQKARTMSTWNCMSSTLPAVLGLCEDVSGRQLGRDTKCATSDPSSEDQSDSTPLEKGNKAQESNGRR